MSELVIKHLGKIEVFPKTRKLLPGREELCEAMLELKPGHAIEIESKHEASQIAMLCRNLEQEHGIKFYVRNRDGKLYVWRAKETP